MGSPRASDTANPPLAGRTSLRVGGVAESFLTWVLLLAVMMPLAVWFAGVKRRNRSWLIRMI